MNLYEEVTAISNSSLAKQKFEFDNIAQEIKSSALIGNRYVLVVGDITKSVRDELFKQGFTIETEYIAGKIYGYTIRW